jgi:hypothetical protein
MPLCLAANLFRVMCGGHILTYGMMLLAIRHARLYHVLTKGKKSTVNLIFAPSRFPTAVEIEDNHLLSTHTFPHGDAWVINDGPGLTLIRPSKTLLLAILEFARVNLAVPVALLWPAPRGPPSTALIEALIVMVFAGVAVSA